MEERIACPPLRAPEQNGDTLLHPSWARLPSVVDENRRRRLGGDCDLQGRSLVDLSDAARAGLLVAAFRYSAQYRDVPAISNGLPTILLAGHQPQLFHPGVWFKNFALGRLAEQIGGVGVNLLIDSDAVRSVAIRVPIGTANRASFETIEFDRSSGPIPYEEKLVLDRALFESFGKRVADRIRPLVSNPLINAYWPIATSLREATDNLGACLAASRHRLEGAWGNETLEIPASAVCRLPEFRWFVAHLLANLPRFIDAHNAALANYRSIHRLRGRTHPASDLIEDNHWIEAPLWVWSKELPQRRRLFVRCRGNAIELTDRANWRSTLSLTDDGDAQKAVEQLAELDAQGIRIRSRALITTLFARLFLGDLFLHGIGGAKYDQVTDDIVRRFFSFTPPTYAAVSATLRLSTETLKDESRDEPRLRHDIREVPFHPERFLGSLEDLPAGNRSLVEQHIAEKRRWIATPKTPENAAERHRAIVAANAGLQPFLSNRLAALRNQHTATTTRVHAAGVLNSREHAFCLHPQPSLSRLLLDTFATIA